MTQKTKKVLKDALVELLKKKQFSKITVSELTKSCNLNRMTFYYHFKDIYDLLDWALCCQADKLVLMYDPKDLAKNMKIILGFLFQQKEVALNIYHSNAVDLLEKYLFKIVDELVNRELSKKLVNSDLEEDDRLMIRNFYNHAFVGIIKDWIKHGLVHDQDEVVEKLALLLKGSMDLAINNLNQKN